jgi:hypothetical protein|tara:strand:+ start:1778 stop:2137 length:360 start_codon:yes stop_codon:yes gene_type:complete
MAKIKVIKEVIKKFKPKIKSKRKKLFPLKTKPGPGKDKWKLDPKSPYYHVDELGSPPLHRGSGPSGVEKKKLKDAGESIEKWFRKKEGKAPVRVQEKLPGMRHGGLIRGFPKIAKKGWR